MPNDLVGELKTAAIEAGAPEYLHERPWRVAKVDPESGHVVIKNPQNVSGPAGHAKRAILTKSVQVTVGKGPYLVGWDPLPGTNFYEVGYASLEHPSDP